MSIYLLRHGATEAGGRYCGSSDVALSAEGWAQMRAAVAGRRWDRVVSSPLRRCSTFAEDLAQERGLPIQIDARLRELHFGAWEGRSAAELHEADPAALGRYWTDPWAYPPPGAEPLPDLQARVLACWRELASRARDEALLLVSHGGPIRVLRAHLEGLDPARLLDLEVPHAALIALPLDPAPCARC